MYVCVRERKRARLLRVKKGKENRTGKGIRFSSNLEERQKRNHAKAEGGSAREGRQGGTAPNVSWGFSVEGGISKSTVSPESFKEQQQKNVYF